MITLLTLALTITLALIGECVTPRFALQKSSGDRASNAEGEASSIIINLHLDLDPKRDPKLNPPHFSLDNNLYPN